MDASHEQITLEEMNRLYSEEGMEENGGVTCPICLCEDSSLCSCLDEDGR